MNALRWLNVLEKAEASIETEEKAVRMHLSLPRWGWFILVAMFVWGLASL